MNGFSRHLVSAFAAYNAQATSRVKTATGDNSITSYTYSISDSNPLYCWAREEGIFTNIMTALELATVVDYTTAVNQGMTVPINEGI